MGEKRNCEWIKAKNHALDKIILQAKDHFLTTIKWDDAFLI